MGAEIHRGFLENDQFNPSHSDSAGRPLKKSFSNGKCILKTYQLEYDWETVTFFSNASTSENLFLLLLYYILCHCILKLLL